MSMPAAHNAAHEKSIELSNNKQKNTELHDYYEKSRIEERTIGQIRQGSSFSKAKIARRQNYSKGTVVYKKSKYQSSSTYLCPESPNGQRPVLTPRSKNNKISSISRQRLGNNNLSLWILCNRKIAKKSQTRKINPIQPPQKHSKTLPITTRRWATALLPLFTPTLRNYYEPLSSYTHDEATIMVRDKAKAAEQMRIRMGNLRSGAPPMMTSNQQHNQQQKQQTGRGGGRYNPYTGRGGGSMSNQSHQKGTENSKGTTAMSSTTTTITDTPRTIQARKEAEELQESVLTISDLTEHTTEVTNNNTDNEEIQEPMEEDDDGLATIMLKGIPKTIPNITPNHQWDKDRQNNLPKRRYGLEIKINPETTPTEDSKIPVYHHPRIFKAITTAIMTAAPGTIICSINDDADMIAEVDEIPTSQSKIDLYLEAPTINMKTHTYHARIHIMCMKPLFILIKNNEFLKWLIENRIYLEENDLSEIMPANAGIILFVRPRNSITLNHHDQLKSTFFGTTAPEFKLKPFKAKSGGEEAVFLLVQTPQGKEDEVSNKFQQASTTNPYEFIGWKNWNNLYSTHKTETIKRQNNYIRDYKLLCLSGFIDDDNVLLGKNPKYPDNPDYSKLTLNEFLVKHYVIGESGPIFHEAMGPFLGTRFFIVSATKWSAGKRLLEQIQYDMLRFMSPEAARAILADYRNMTTKAIVSPFWTPTWYEEQIVVIPQQDMEREPESTPTKRKKTPQVSKSIGNTSKNQEQSIIHHAHTQQANKALSAAASTEDDKKIAHLTSQVSELQDGLMEMSTLVGKMSENQYRDRNTIIALQSELETVSKKTESARADINKCQVALTTMESKLGTLSTREESNQRFDEIKSLLVEQTSRRGRRLLLTGKRKEQIQEEDEEMGKEDEEDIFVDSSPTMDTEESATSVRNNQERGGDNTNSLVVYEQQQTTLK
jgi:hypothetical protein